MWQLRCCCAWWLAYGLPMLRSGSQDLLLLAVQEGRLWWLLALQGSAFLASSCDGGADLLTWRHPRCGCSTPNPALDLV